MKLSTSTEQACCVLILVAESSKPITNAELSRRMDVSPSYLTKITRRLVVAGLISSAPGAKGGFILSKPMRLISLLSIIEAMEGAQSFFQSTGVFERVFAAKAQAVHSGLLLVHDVFHDAEQAWRQKLSEVSMQEIINNAIRTENG